MEKSSETKHQRNSLPILNIYCDESCHLSHDKAKYMILGAVSCPKEKIRSVNKELKEIKNRHGINEVSEVKWSDIREKNILLYKDLINYFFKNEYLSFSALCVNKQIAIKSFEDFYYLHYCYLLANTIVPNKQNKIYIDEKDTRNAQRISKVSKVENVLKKVFVEVGNIIKPIQVIKSHEIQIMQLVDIMVAALSYNANHKDKNRNCKREIIQLIKERSKYSLETSTLLMDTKFRVRFEEHEAGCGC